MTVCRDDGVAGGVDSAKRGGDLLDRNRRFFERRISDLDRLVKGSQSLVLTRRLDELALKAVHRLLVVGDRPPAECNLAQQRSALLLYLGKSIGEFLQPLFGEPSPLRKGRQLGFNFSPLHHETCYPLNEGLYLASVPHERCLSRPPDHPLDADRPPLIREVDDLCNGSRASSSTRLFRSGEA